MRKVASSQDLIPLTCFMEGKLSKEIFLLQQHLLSCSPSRLTTVNWSRHLISHRCCNCPMHNGCFGLYHSMIQPRDK